MSSRRSRLVRAIPSLRWRDELLAQRLTQVERLRGRISRCLTQVERLQGRIRRLEESLELATENHDRLSRKLADQQATLTTTQAKRQRAEHQIRVAVELIDAEDEARARERVTPSFREQYKAELRMIDRAAELDPEGRHPYRQMKLKLRNYQFAASHGIAVPEVYQSWSKLSQVDPSEAPERFVLKSDFGSTHHGVFLLERTSDDQFRTLDGGDVIDLAAIRTAFGKRVESGQIGGPYFIEEMLVSSGADSIPNDVKIYAAYGHVLQVLLRRVSVVEGKPVITYRYVDGDGADLGDVTAVRHIDPTIPVPENLTDMLEISRHLTRALGVPFCRVDLFNTTRGIVLGELTPTPGGPQEYRLDHDARMGAIWRDAQLDRGLDLVHGRPFGRIYGELPVPDLYPADHLSQADDPGPWQMLSQPCSDWCGNAGRSTQSGEAGKTKDSEPAERFSLDRSRRRGRQVLRAGR